MFEENKTILPKAKDPKQVQDRNQSSIRNQTRSDHLPNLHQIQQSEVMKPEATKAASLEVLKSEPMTRFELRQDLTHI